MRGSRYPLRDSLHYEDEKPSEISKALENASMLRRSEFVVRHSGGDARAMCGKHEAHASQELVSKLQHPGLLHRRVANYIAQIAETSCIRNHALEQPGCFKRL